MKAVIYTQRVEIIESYNEHRDCADQNIPRFIQVCGYLPIPTPNVLEDLEKFIDYIKPSGIMLTGGNSLLKYGGTAPERDRTDAELIGIAKKNKIPVYGFCRGMQSVLDHFGCNLENVSGHAVVRHRIHGEWGEFEANSYHNQACRQIKAPLKAVAVSDDGIIEAVECKEHRIIATMWHPEREAPFTEADIMRVRQLFR